MKIGKYILRSYFLPASFWFLLVLSNAYGQVKDPFIEEPAVVDPMVVEMNRRLEANPEDWEAIYNLGVLAYRIKDYNKAAYHFTRLFSCPDQRIREKALFQLGNAQVRLAETNGGYYRAVPALDEALNTYGRLEGTRLSDEAEHNRRNTFERFESISISSAQRLFDSGTKASESKQRNHNFSLALETLSPLLIREPDHPDAKALREKIAKEYAQNLAKSASQLEEKAQKLWEEGKGRDSDSRLTKAIELLERASELLPEDQAIKEQLQAAQERLAEQLIDSVENVLEKKKDFDNMKRQLPTLDRVDELLADSSRTEPLREEISRRMEQDVMNKADRAAEEYAQMEDPTMAAVLLQIAVENYHKALTVNPDNTRAQEQLAELEPELGQSFHQMAEEELQRAEELASAATEAESPGEGTVPEPESGEDANGLTDKDLKDAIMHLEKANSGFAHAESLGFKPEGTDASKQKAEELLNEMREELDKRLAGQVAAAAEKDQGAGEKGDEDSSSDSASPEPPKMGTFASIRKKYGANAYSKKAAEDGRDW
ncbi:hypothetical protein [Rubellicoccus peritrichatus]|uniref:Tetratricopeptide repeat protein n=1 Tax=Rubellicoccus peritrichatus TaxID=3080537 RepID=A0AAQ3QYA1_9BACT|nr:hypothetical protein [Puniceicoccus sp. CR14]WOO43605.1 hypothetical protein RZN69_10945 [Puniceicoccus sp. CR14]